MQKIGVFKGMKSYRETLETPYFNAVVLKSFFILYLRLKFYHTLEKNQNMLLHPPKVKNESLLNFLKNNKDSIFAILYLYKRKSALYKNRPLLYIKKIH